MSNYDTSSKLLAISPIDGRYRSKIEDLSALCSEFGLIRYRVGAEVEWLRFLVQHLRLASQSTLSEEELQALSRIFTSFTVDDAQRVRTIENETNHDVKAVEYFVKEALEAEGLNRISELVHFGCTSEDINNIAYAAMLSDVRVSHLTKGMKLVIEKLIDLAQANTETPMLSRTHGQTASPTTLGKELVNVALRLTGWLETLNNVEIRAKMNGAVGNFNAHAVALPDIDWITASKAFVESIGLTVNPYTTQIEPHDWIAEYLNALVGFNQVLLDFDRDVWGYISIHYFKQRQIEGEVGSSTMPHKVNPIDFENAEGNVGVANSLARHLADKLQISRWQRDLTDSTALRNLGAVFAHSLIAMQSTIRGIGKLEVDEQKMAIDLDGAWEVLAEPVQTVMRLQGIANPYERVKAATRGKQMNEQSYRDMVLSLELEPDIRDKLLALKPERYVGLAADLANRGIEEVKNRLTSL